jgi:hypothetical protein
MKRLSKEMEYQSSHADLNAAAAGIIVMPQQGGLGSR